MTGQIRWNAWTEKLLRGLGNLTGKCPVCGYPIMRHSDKPHDPKGEGLARCTRCGAILASDKRY